jgi:hypothetical protein
MNRGLKITLIAISVLLVLVVAGGYVTLRIFGEAFGTECERSSSWTINEYRIQEYKCLGWAGPHYYPLDLYRDDKKISEGGHKIDSCTIRFIPANDVYLKLNICDNTMVELRPKKVPLAVVMIDSVIIHRTENDQFKKLEQNQIEEFVRKWNEAPVFDFRDDEKPFYPKSSYFVFVYTDGNVIKFETGNFMIKDSDNWSYNFLDKDEEVGYEKFDEMWSK